MFKVDYNKIRVQPLEEAHIIEDDKVHYIEKGKILEIGSGLSGTAYKVGRILYFKDYSCSQTAKDSEGNRHWVVLVNDVTILGVETDE